MKKLIDKKLFLNINAILGVIFTAISCHNGTIKDIDEYSDSMSTKEKIKHYIKCYGPTVAFASGTIFSIFLSNHISQKEKYDLMMELIKARNSYTKLRGSVNGIDSEQRTKVIKSILPEDVPKDIYDSRTELKIFWEEYSGEFIYKTIEEVLKAEYNFNKKLSVVGYASLNDFLNELGIEEITCGNEIGWNINDGYFGGQEVSPLVDFVHSKCTTDDGCEFYYLSYNNQPEPNYI